MNWPTVALILGLTLAILCVGAMRMIARLWRGLDARMAAAVARHDEHHEEARRSIRRGARLSDHRFRL
ncbi:hypothetical protein [Roseomonas elaeocarpi]|uniref:Uncharacterized protein n=1 Tax=Roseomonas elaeocarpi TaxID=907779 RepID=A0ABV6JZB7_9PROT